jgi:hypothetical protein
MLDGSDMKEDPFRKDKFRAKILEKLGNVGEFDSGAENNGAIDGLHNNFAEGLDVPSDMDYDER